MAFTDDAGAMASLLTVGVRKSCQRVVCGRSHVGGIAVDACMAV